MKDLSRRSFLKGALASAASVAAVGVAGVPALVRAEGIYTPGTYSAQAQGMGTSRKLIFVEGMPPHLMLRLRNKKLVNKLTKHQLALLSPRSAGGRISAAPPQGNGAAVLGQTSCWCRAL